MAVYKPTFHPKQKKLYDALNHGKRFLALNCGRRWGKSYFSTKLAIINLLQGKRVAYIVPKYSFLDDVWDEIHNTLQDFGQIKSKNGNEGYIATNSGGFIRFYSTDKDDNPCRGYNWDLVIVDEAGLMPGLVDILYKAVWATLGKTKGKVIVISTPRAISGGFYKVYTDWNNKSRLNAEYYAYSGPQHDNTLENGGDKDITLETVEAQRKDMSEAAYNQEILAIPSADSGLVFKYLTSILIPVATSDEISMYSVDVASDFDWTVIIGWNKHKEVISFERFQGINTNALYEQITSNITKLVPIIIDATHGSIGRGICDDLVMDGYNMIPFEFTKKSKPELIERLIINIENQSIKIVEAYSKIIVQECEDLEYIVSDTGYKSYKAPSGKKDDAVMCLAMGNWYFHGEQMNDNGLASASDIMTGPCTGIIGEEYNFTL